MRAKVPALVGAFVLQLFTLAPAHGAAWTSEKGHGEFILTSSWFQTTTGYDMQGNRQPFGYNGRFRKFDLNPYLELGVGKRTSVIVNAFVPRLEFANDYGRSASFGAGDIETGVRRRLNSSSSRTAISVQGLVSFPAYSANRTPPPGNHQIDFEPRLLVGRGYQLEQQSIFWNVETAFRLRTGAPADQVRLDGTVGANLHRRLMVMGQTFGIVGLRNGEPFRAGTNPNVQPDFDLGKLQVSAVVRVNRSLRVQTAVFQTFLGRNTGYSRGALVSFWYAF